MGDQQHLVEPEKTELQQRGIDIDEYTNDFGSIRRGAVWGGYFQGKLDLDDVTALYRRWRDTNEYIILEGVEPGGLITSDDNYVLGVTGSATKLLDSWIYPEDGGRVETIEHEDKTLYKLVKAAKRGNDVYRSRVREKFGFLRGLPPIEFFDRDKRGIKTTPMLLLTLTYGLKKCKHCGTHYKKDRINCPSCGRVGYEAMTVGDAWNRRADGKNDIGEHLHDFETKLRQAFGKYRCKQCGHTFMGYRHCPKCKKNPEVKALLKHVECVGSFVKLRVWEAHDSYMPHCHMVVYFHEREFPAFKHVNNDNKATWRIPWVLKEKINGMWKAGNVDVQACSDTDGALSEVVKYITKEIWSDKNDKTNAMVWLFRKQSYSISKRSPFRKWPLCPDCHEVLWELSDEEKDQVFADNMAYKCPSCGEWYSSDEAKNFNKQKVLRPGGAWCESTGNYKKDFIGAMWGFDVWRDLYMSDPDGVSEPDTYDLVKQHLQNCNIDWRLVGFLNGKRAGISPDIWIKDVRDPPDRLKFAIGEAIRDFKARRG